MPQLRQAFASASKGSGTPYDPKLTIICCSKTRRTCFYPTEEHQAACDGNPKPGTIVDSGIASVYNFDFFLQGMSPLHIAHDTPFLLGLTYTVV